MTGRPKKANPFAVFQEKDDKATEGKTQIWSPRIGPAEGGG